MDKTGLEDYQTKLLDLRNQLNTIDEKLIILLISRFSITNEIGRLKQINNQPIYDQKREATIIQTISDIIRNNHQSNNHQSNNHQSNNHQNNNPQDNNPQDNNPQDNNKLNNNATDAEMLVACVSEIYREIMKQSKKSQSNED